MRRREVPELDHLREHRIAALQGALRVEHRVVVAVALEHADQRGAFEHVEAVSGFVEVGARGHFDAVRVVEKRHRVQIGFEDLALGVKRFDLERGDRFLQLAREGLRAADLVRIKIARELLGDRRSTLAVAGKGMQRSGPGASPVETVMLVEAVIFGGDERVDHIRRDFREMHPLTVGRPEFGEQLAVG